jgi:hypothetical protein
VNSTLHPYPVTNDIQINKAHIFNLYSRSLTITLEEPKLKFTHSSIKQIKKITKRYEQHFISCNSDKYTITSHNNRLDTHSLTRRNILPHNYLESDNSSLNNTVYFLVILNANT